MLNVANTTRYVVEAEVLRDKSGAETLVVVTKGTFVVKPDGHCAVDEVQAPIVRVPEYIGRPGHSSLLSESDFILVKPTTDLLVLGHAYAPAGSQATSVIVGMQVGSVTKRLRVWGDRRWQKGALRWSASDPDPFDRLPMIYERAFGGSIGEPSLDGVWSCDVRNPIGRGFGASENRQEGDLLHNIEYEDARDTPAGVGPIPRHWQPRVPLAGTYDDAWRADRFPLPPHDLDDRFYNAAPTDQQPQHLLVGGEPVRLLNLTSTGSWQFSLPRVWLVFNTQIGHNVHAHRAQLHTVTLQPDARRLVLTWVSTLRCHGFTSRLGTVHVREKPLVPLSAAVSARAAS